MTPLLHPAAIEKHESTTDAWTGTKATPALTYSRVRSQAYPKRGVIMAYQSPILALPRTSELVRGSTAEPSSFINPASPSIPSTTGPIGCKLQPNVPPPIKLLLLSAVQECVIPPE